MSGRFTRAGATGRRGATPGRAVTDDRLDARRTAFAVALLAHCALDLRPADRVRFWRKYAETLSLDGSGGRTLLETLTPSVAAMTAPVRTHLDALAEDAPFQLLRRRYDERAELALELDASDETRMRLVREMVLELGLTLTEEVGAALALAGQEEDAVPPPPVDELDMDLELESFDDEFARIAAHGDPDG